jgi:hypothetical protein
MIANEYHIRDVLHVSAYYLSLGFGTDFKNEDLERFYSSSSKSMKQRIISYFLL